MVPSLNEADCRVAESRLRLMRAETAWRHRAGAAPGVGRHDPSGGGVLRARIGALLVRAGQRLQGVPTAGATPAPSTAAGWGR